MLERIVVLQMRWHHARVLRRQGIFLDLLVRLFFIFIVIVIAALVLEVGWTFVFVGLSILLTSALQAVNFPCNLHMCIGVVSRGCHLMRTRTASYCVRR